MRAFCTLFDRNYLGKALALVGSLDAHERGDWRLYVVCLDEITRVVLTSLAHPRLVLVPLHELEAGDERLLAAKRGRTAVEYYWTLSSTTLLWLLENDPAIDVLTYLDADLFFFRPTQAIADQLGDGAALIHRQDFSPDLAHLERESGTYNVGVVAIRNDARGRAILRWWRDRCLEWCHARYEDGKMGDQMYLNQWPARFDGVVVARGRGIGLAPWNHLHAPISLDAGGLPRAGAEPVVCYHLHALSAVKPGIVVPARHLAYRLTLPLLRHVYLPYLAALDRAQRTIEAAVGGEFPFGRSSDVLTPGHTFLARRAYRPALRAAGVDHPVVELDGGWDCHATPQLLT
jgi:hypothetical protein